MAIDDENVVHVGLLVGLDDGFMLSAHGIEYEGGVWLVAGWLVENATGDAVPERMIRVDTLEAPLQKVDDGPFDYANVLLPKAVLEGRTQEAEGFEVRSLPERPRVDSRRIPPLPHL